VTDFLERKATVGVSPGEEQIINNVAWTVYGGKSTTIFISNDLTFRIAASDTVSFSP
jgi:hypothetical protein